MGVEGDFVCVCAGGVCALYAYDEAEGEGYEGGEGEEGAVEGQDERAVRVGGSGRKTRYTRIQPALGWHEETACLHCKIAGKSRRVSRQWALCSK